MTEDTFFPPISEASIGGDLIQTTGGRDLHRSLKVGSKFATWMRRRIKEYGFVKEVDYVTTTTLSDPNLGSSKARPQRTIEYHLTLDMAKELSMVENNEQGRAVRRYFIQCEKAVKSLPAPVIEQIARTFGVAKMTNGKVTDIQRQMVERPLVSAFDMGNTVSAYDMIEMAGITAESRQRGTAQLVTKRMIGFCADRQVACIRTPATFNPSRPYRFPAPVAGEWLLGDARGLELIRTQVDRMKARKAAKGKATGQGHLRLLPPSPPAEDRPSA